MTHILYMHVYIDFIEKYFSLYVLSSNLEYKNTTAFTNLNILFSSSVWFVRIYIYVVVKPLRQSR